LAGKRETLDIVPRYLITGRRALGASFGGVKGREQVPQFVERYMAGDIDVNSFIPHRLTLDQVNDGFEFMHGQVGPTFSARHAALDPRPPPTSSHRQPGRTRPRRRRDIGS
jgi:hypothetical protein